MRVAIEDRIQRGIDAFLGPGEADYVLSRALVVGFGDSRAQVRRTARLGISEPKRLEGFPVVRACQGHKLAERHALRIGCREVIAGAEFPFGKVALQREIGKRRHL